MYQDHPSFKQPPESSYIWRYMDFTKFVALLDTSALFFTRSDKFEDPYEGSYPELNISERFLTLGEGFRDYSAFAENMRKHMAINCWHVNQSESVAMWKLYLKSNEGIAVRSTVKRLKDSLNSDMPIQIGLVNYINYQKEAINPSNIYHPYLTKRKSFEHEKEIRAIIMKIPFDGDPKNPKTPVNYFLETMEYGLNIDVNLDTLIDSIFVSPDSPQWIFELVLSVTKRYGYDFKVWQSEMNAKPLF